MPEFIADTDGEVLGQSWDDLRPFTQGYIECMLFTNTCSGISMVEWLEPENVEAVTEGRADGSIPTDSGYGDIHPDSMMRAHLDCNKFIAEARHLLSLAYARGYEEVQAGRDFWYDRNGHGVGFTDRDILDNTPEYIALGSPRVDEPNWAKWEVARADSLGRKLSEIARTYREMCVDFVPDESSPTGYGYVYIT